MMKHLYLRNNKHQTIFNMQTLIEQLQFAVTNNNGKTVLCQQDIDTMKMCLKQLKERSK